MKFLLSIFLFSCLTAKELDADKLNNIYTEGILFVSVFGIMAIVSIIVSKRNAKKFEDENPLEERKAIRREEMLKKELEDMPISIKNHNLDKLIELSKMLKNDLISQKEFDMLKANLDIKDS